MPSLFPPITCPNPNHARLVREFAPKRLVCWLQDELKRYNAEREGEPFTRPVTDFRRTAITGLQMAGVSEKETSLMVGPTPEVIRENYEKLDAMAIGKRNIERRLAVNHQSPAFVAPVARTARTGT